MSNKIAAFDPGFAATGIAILEKLPGLDWDIVDIACIRTQPAKNKQEIRVAHDDSQRVALMTREIVMFLQKHGPIKRMVVEIPDGGGQSARAVRAMALATGMIVTIGEILEMASEWYDPRSTRRAAGVPTSVVGRGDVKEIVMRNMAVKYSMIRDWKTKAEREHVADALATFEAARAGNLVRGTV